MDTIKAVFFDADDTLVDHKECERQALLYLFTNIGVRYQEDYQNIFRPLDRQLWEGATHGNSSVLEKDIPIYRFKRLFELINIQYDHYETANDLFKKGLANSVALQGGSEEIVEYLYHKGYIVCVVTNGLTALQKPRVTNSKIGKYISHIIVSEEVGAHKPNPLIFTTLLTKLGIAADNTIMIAALTSKKISHKKNSSSKGK